MVGMFAGIGRLVGFMVGGWLAGWFVCYPVCRLVEPSGRLAISNLSPFDQPTIHPRDGSSIYLIAIQPTKDCTFISACIKSVFEFPESGVWRLPVFARLVGCGGATWPITLTLTLCSQVAGQVWSVFHLASQGGIPSLLDRLSSDLGTLKKGCATCFAMPCTYIFSCCVYSSQCSPYPLYL